MERYKCCPPDSGHCHLHTASQSTDRPPRPPPRDSRALRHTPAEQASQLGEITRHFLTAHSNNSFVNNKVFVMIIYIHIERPTQDICSRIAGEETDRISQIFLQNDT